MMRMIVCVCFCLTIFSGFLFVGNADALLLDLGDITRDTNSGLDWLDMRFSVGVSADSIIAETDPLGLASQGWMHASLDQITNIVVNAGMTEPFNGTQSPWNYDSASLILELFGPTGSNGDSVYIQSFASEGPVPSILYTPVVIASLGTVGGADIPGPGVPSSVTNPTIGNWLVRESAAPVPEPSTIVLLGLGLVGLAGFGRKKMKR